LLVGGIPTPLKNMSSSVGKDYSIESHRLWNIENVQNHQPVDEHIDIWDSIATHLDEYMILCNTIYKAYVREYPHNSYGQKYGTNVPPF